MTDTYAMAPKQALEMIEAAGVEDAAKLIRDHAAAGLVRSYALSQVAIDARGSRAQVRGGAISPDAWERIIGEGVDSDVWGGGTVRLSGSDLVGGVTALHITGVAFHADDIERLARQQRPPHGRMKAKRANVEQAPAIKGADEEQAAEPIRQRRAPDLSLLHSGALLLTVDQTGAALARGRTWISDRIKEGKLVQPEGDTRITAASVRMLAGLADT